MGKPAFGLDFGLKGKSSFNLEIGLPITSHPYYQKVDNETGSIVPNMALGLSVNLGFTF